MAIFCIRTWCICVLPLMVAGSALDNPGISLKRTSPQMVQVEDNHLFAVHYVISYTDMLFTIHLQWTFNGSTLIESHDFGNLSTYKNDIDLTHMRLISGEQSNGKQTLKLTVRINRVKKEKRGNYTLTINYTSPQEPPAYRTVSDTVTLKVLYVPQGNPICSISPNTTVIVAGEKRIKLTCTSELAEPPVNIDFHEHMHGPPLPSQRNSEEVRKDLTKTIRFQTVDATFNGSIFECEITSKSFDNFKKTCSIGPLLVIPETMTTPLQASKTTAPKTMATTPPAPDNTSPQSSPASAPQLSPTAVVVLVPVNSVLVIALIVTCFVALRRKRQTRDQSPSTQATGSSNAAHAQYTINHGSDRPMLRPDPAVSSDDGDQFYEEIGESGLHTQLGKVVSAKANGSSHPKGEGEKHELQRLCQETAAGGEKASNSMMPTCSSNPTYDIINPEIIDSDDEDEDSTEEGDTIHMPEKRQTPKSESHLPTADSMTLNAARAAAHPSNSDSQDGDDQAQRTREVKSKQNLPSKANLRVNQIGQRTPLVIGSAEEPYQALHFSSALETDQETARSIPTSTAAEQLCNVPDNRDMPMKIQTLQQVQQTVTLDEEPSGDQHPSNTTQRNPNEQTPAKRHTAADEPYNRLDYGIPTKGRHDSSKENAQGTENPHNVAGNGHTPRRNQDVLTFQIKVTSEEQPYNVLDSGSTANRNQDLQKTETLGRPAESTYNILNRGNSLCRNQLMQYEQVSEKKIRPKADPYAILDLGNITSSNQVLRNSDTKSQTIEQPYEVPASGKHNPPKSPSLGNSKEGSCSSRGENGQHTIKTRSGTEGRAVEQYQVPTAGNSHLAQNQPQSNNTEGLSSSEANNEQKDETSVDTRNSTDGGHPSARVNDADGFSHSREGKGLKATQSVKASQNSPDREQPNPQEQPYKVPCFISSPVTHPINNGYQTLQLDSEERPGNV